MKNTIIIVCVALLVGFGVGYFVNHQGASVSGFAAGHTEISPWSFANGAAFGQTNVSYFDNAGTQFLRPTVFKALKVATTSLFQPVALL